MVEVGIAIFRVEIAVACAQARRVRAIAICAVLVGCGGREAMPAERVVAVPPALAREPIALSASDAASRSSAPEPGLRLPDGIAPIAYDLTLELDPARASFTGRVAITIAVTAPGTTRLWLHAVDLDIARATLRRRGHEVAVALLDGGSESQMRGFALPEPIGAAAGETVTLLIDYTGAVRDLSHHISQAGQDQAGMFRERAGGRWYLYSQAESVFARKLVPCFDEPRWKPAWRVTTIAPRDQVALANAPQAAERVLPDGRRETRFAEIRGLPSYLLAFAVGPFEVVDGGHVGRGKTPVRIAVAPGDGSRVTAAVRALPNIVDALEGYLDARLPVAKLDLVAVPQFFGAMENTGLITFQTAVLVGGRDLVAVAAHELAHLWFGNSVTAAWWDDLWLSEAFATWLGERVTAQLGGAGSPELAHQGRVQAFAADDAVAPEPLVHPIAALDDIEPAFDAIAYEKGAAVLAMFESFVGVPAFQAAVRAYITGHAGTSVTSQAFIDALAAATSRSVGDALASNLVHAGTPVVELALRCDTAPAIVAEARGGVTIPVCVRLPAPATGPAPARLCFLAGPHTEQALPGTGCPAWVVDNAAGRGYYRTLWRGRAPRPPVTVLSPEERLARGDDTAAAVRHGELPVSDALREIAALADAHVPGAALAALAIARAIDPIVADAVRPAWTTWLAARFADRLTRAALAEPSTAADDLVRSELVELAADAIAPATLAAAREIVVRSPDGSGDPLWARLAAVRDADWFFDRIIAAAATAKTDELRDDLLADLGRFPAAYAPRIADLALDPRFTAAQIWPALAALLARGATRTGTWRALHARLPAVLRALGTDRTSDLLTATSSLCDPGARAEVAADFTPALATISGGQQILDRALAAIDRCIARRAAAGDIASSLSSWRRTSTSRR